jgi:cGMP-dependent protein kinase
MVAQTRIDGARWRTTGRSNSFRFIPGEPSICERLAREKTPADEALIAASLRGNPNLRKFAPFNDEQIKTLASAAWKETLEEGAVLMHEGDLNNETFYIVASGSFEVTSDTVFDVVTAQGCSYLSRPPPAKAAAKDDVLDPGVWTRQRSDENVDACPSSPPKLPKVKSGCSLASLGEESKDKNTVHVVQRGCSFGDSSMFYGVPRWATMTALERSTVWVLSQSTFRTLQAQIRDAAVLTTKSSEDADLIAEGFAFNANLRMLVKLTSEHIKQLGEAAWIKTLAKGEVLMNEGDLNADACYIIGGGEWAFEGTEPFKVVSKQPGKTGPAYLHRAAHAGARLDAKAHGLAAEKPTEVVGTRGLCFGEVSMLYCAPRFATVTAMTDGCYMLAIDRASFQAVQMKAAEDEINSRVKHLNRLHCFNQFGERDKQKFAGIMEKMSFQKGDHVVKQGEMNTALYILEEGKVSYSRGGSPAVQLEADPQSGVVHFFGSEALVMDESGDSDTALVESEDAIALVLEQAQFEKICDRLVEAAPAPAFTRYATTASKAAGPKHDALIMSNLTVTGLLGVSVTGPVELCRHKHTKELYALKSMNKGLVVQKGLRKSVIREKKLSMEIIHPNIVRVVATFNEQQTLHFLMEAALGGELCRTYKQQDLYGSARHTRYYAACVILALDHLHQRRIIYRNLKPKNILLSHQGHPKLTDMGISKLVVSNTFTTCGTPMYMAPEVVAGIGHNRAADWWSLGVLIFELMSGKSPFESVHPMEIYSKVMRGIARVNFPSECHGNAGDLVRSLLMPKAVDRLPMKQGGVQKLLDHPWFDGFQWEGLRSQQLEPPFVPMFQVQPRDWKDLRDDQCQQHLLYFAPDRTSLPRQVEYKEDEYGDPGWDADFA